MTASIHAGNVNIISAAIEYQEESIQKSDAPLTHTGQRESPPETASGRAIAKRLSQFDIPFKDDKKKPDFTTLHDLNSAMTAAFDGTRADRAIKSLRTFVDCVITNMASCTADEKKEQAQILGQAVKTALGLLDYPKRDNAGRITEYRRVCLAKDREAILKIAQRVLCPDNESILGSIEQNDILSSDDRREALQSIVDSWKSASTRLYPQDGPQTFTKIDKYINKKVERTKYTGEVTTALAIIRAHLVSPLLNDQDKADLMVEALRASTHLPLNHPRTFNNLFGKEDRFTAAVDLVDILKEAKASDENRGVSWKTADSMFLNVEASWQGRKVHMDSSDALRAVVDNYIYKFMDPEVKAQDLPNRGKFILDDNNNRTGRLRDKPRDMYY